MNKSILTFRTVFLFITTHCAGILAAQVPPQFTDLLVTDQLNEVTSMTFDSAGRIYACEKAGRVYVMQNSALSPTLLLDISEEVGNWNEHGLLGIVLHPNFLSNGYFFIFYTVDRHHLLYYGTPGYSATTSSFFEATIDRVTRYQANADSGYTTIVPDSRLVLIGESKYAGIPVLTGNHDGGALLFGEDKSLLVLTGDASKGGPIPDSGSLSGTYFAQALADSIIRPKENVGAFRAQLPDNLNGKVLRIDPNTGNGLPGNPFYSGSNPRSPLSRLWALGLRNPFKAWLIKGTGNVNPFYKDPGTILIHDVGAGKREEINFCELLGLNFGWPIYEGIAANPAYMNVTCYNLDAPNPLAAQGCQPYFSFRNLLIHESLGTLSWPNPCNKLMQIPSSIKRFKHKRGILDYSHVLPQVRVAGFTGPVATYKFLGDSTLPVSGSPYKGRCNAGGPFIHNDALGSQYKNCVFQCDYNEGWIKLYRFSNYNQLLGIEAFANNMGNILGLTFNYFDSSLYYVKFPNEIRKIKVHATNLPPEAKIVATPTFGNSPLTVSFSAAASTDPENDSMQYFWWFSNGATAMGTNVVCTFTTTTTLPHNAWAKLVAIDAANNSDTSTAVIYLNNQPPIIDITSIADSGLYSTQAASLQLLNSSAYDDNTMPQNLKYAWYTTLHHNTHIHPEPVDSAANTYAIIGPEGCNEPHYYSFRLEVTDSMGLKSSMTKVLLPDCGQKWQLYSDNPSYTITVSPNPASGVLYINAPQTMGGSISVFNSLGEVVLVQKMSDFKVWQTIALNIESLPAGLYLLQVTNDYHSQLVKFIKT